MNIGLATEGDFGAFVELAAEVEDLFGPMVGEPGFHDAVRRNISRRSAFLARGPRSTPAGGLLFLLTTTQFTSWAGLSSRSGTARRGWVKLSWQRHSVSG